MSIEATPAPQPAEAVPRCCGTCKHWQVETFPPDGPHVWGSCTVGLPPNCTLDTRMTVDLMSCSVGYELRTEAPK